MMLALKGDSAAAEIERDAVAVRRAGGGEPRIVRCGAGIVEPLSTVVVVERVRGSGRPAGPRRRRGQA
jgi:16S rRNA (guanine527-N7)-methyltransferase